MYSPTLELGKRGGQLPLLQVPSVHWAQQPHWVLQLAKGTEHKKSISKCKKWLHSSEKGWCHHLCKTNQPRSNNQTSIIQYNLWKQILCEVSQGRICLQLSCSSLQQPQQQEAPRHLQIKTHKRNTFNGKRDTLPSTHSLGFGYWHSLGKLSRILILQGKEKTRIKKGCFIMAKDEH